MVPYMRAEQLFYRKEIHKDESVTEIKLWGVPVSFQYPFGVRYSFYWVKGQEILVGYDNHFPKGPHRHYGDLELKYEFVSVEKLFEDFGNDKKRILYEGS